MKRLINWIYGKALEVAKISLMIIGLFLFSIVFGLMVGGIIWFMVEISGGLLQINPVHIKEHWTYGVMTYMPERDPSEANFFIATVCLIISLVTFIFSLIISLLVLLEGGIVDRLKKLFGLSTDKPSQ